MDKGLDLDRVGLVSMEKPYLAHRVLPRDDGPVEVEQPVGESERLGRGNRHLRRGVEMQIRDQRTRHRRETEILHDDRVHAAGAEKAQLLRRVLELGWENERVKRNKTPHSVTVKELHELREVFGSEIIGANPRVKPGHAEVNRIGPVRHGGSGALPVACGGE